LRESRVTALAVFPSRVERGGRFSKRASEQSGDGSPLFFFPLHEQTEKLN
jgi:hypothetical protein